MTDSEKSPLGTLQELSAFLDRAGREGADFFGGCLTGRGEKNEKRQGDDAKFNHFNPHKTHSSKSAIFTRHYMLLTKRRI